MGTIAKIEMSMLVAVIVRRCVAAAIKLLVCGIVLLSGCENYCPQRGCAAVTQMTEGNEPTEFKESVNATRLRLEKTYITECFVYAPATMADFAKYMEDASRDLYPFGMSASTTCIAFVCSDSSACRVFPPRPAKPESMICTFSGKGITLWDAFTNACKLTDCTFTVSTNYTVYIDHISR